jgi:hypothetical protein
MRLQHFLRELVDALNSPAMQRLKRKDLKDQQVERALESG